MSHITQGVSQKALYGLLDVLLKDTYKTCKQVCISGKYPIVGYEKGHDRQPPNVLQVISYVSQKPIYSCEMWVLEK